MLVGGRQVPVLFWTARAIGILMNSQAYDHRAMALETSYRVQVVLTGAGKKSNSVGFLLTSGPPPGSAPPQVD